MSDSNQPHGPQDDWIEVGQGRAARHQEAQAQAAMPSAPPAEERVLARRQATPPGKISMRVGVIAFAIMLAVYIFADIREVEIPGQRQFRIGYALMLIPVLGVLWGVIGLVRRQAGDVRLAAIGTLLSLAAFGLGAALISARTQPRDTAPVIENDRMRMTPAELSEWREERLRREPQ